MLAICLVLIAALLHAIWNLLAKKIQASALSFTYVTRVGSSLLYTPPALLLIYLNRPHVGPKELIAIAGTALLHFLYFMSLQRGYAKGDLSLVYPRQRHSPLLTTLGAIWWLGERPSTLALSGSLLIIICVFLITLSARPRLNPSNNED
ncbi:MAG: DMT family transporter [Deinococcales bacterium]